MKQEQSTIDKIRSRPRFKMFTHLNPEEYAENLKIYLKDHQEEFFGNVNREIATISVKTSIDEYWKPQLSLRTEKDEDGQTVIRGIFGPSPSLWTFFMFLYFLWSIAWMVFITLWFVGKQIKTDEYTWCLAASFGCLLLLIATYAASRYGQYKAKKEMAQLRRFAMESTLPHEK